MGGRAVVRETKASDKNRCYTGPHKESGGGRRLKKRCIILGLVTDPEGWCHTQAGGRWKSARHWDPRRAAPWLECRHTLRYCCSGSWAYPGSKEWPSEAGVSGRKGDTDVSRRFFPAHRLW